MLEIVRSLGRFGDLRLEKGGRVCTPHWWIAPDRVSAVWVGRARVRFNSRGSFATLL
jgi:hypothetical protein